MAPINADVGEVAAQLSAIRVRRNSLTAQRALAAALSIALVAASLVVAAALRGSAALFALAITLAGAGSIAGIAYAAWHARQQWLSLPATAQLADTHAALDERLTTLLAVAPLAPPPALRPLLVDQVIGARQRWGLDALAPQRFSRWLGLVPLALLIFAATAFYARPPAVVEAGHTSAKPLRPHAQTLAGATVVERSTQEDSLFAKDGKTTALVTGARDGARNDGTHGAASDGAAGDTKDSAASSAGAGTMPSDSAASGADGQLDGLRQSIREAFGAPPDDTAHDNSDEGRHAAGAGKRDGTSGKSNAPQPDGTSTADGRADGNPRADTTNASTSAATPGADPGAGGQNGHGSGHGGAGSNGSNGVLGAAGSPRMEAGSGAPVAIRLNALTGVSPSQSEPQRRTDGVPASATNASRADRNLPDLANEQLADVTMQQLEVGPEHEAIIRRLFTRE